MARFATEQWATHATYIGFLLVIADALFVPLVDLVR